MREEEEDDGGGGGALDSPDRAEFPPVAMGRSLDRCRFCDVFGKHPICPCCDLTMHGIGYVLDRGSPNEEIEKGAPKRTIRYSESPLALAYLVPFLVDRGLIPEDRRSELTRRMLGAGFSKLLPSAVWEFKYSKGPYAFDVVDADLTGDTEPFVTVRYGGWVCKDHRGILACDIPPMILDRDLFSCIICGREDGLAADYMVPLKHKGRTNLANLATFCLGCREARGEKDYWKFVKERGLPLDDFLMDGKTGFLRSIIVGGKFRI